MYPLNKSTSRVRVILYSLAAIQFVHIMDFMVMMPLGPQLMRSFEISPEQFGMLVSSYTFAAGIMGLFGSFFLDRVGRKSGVLFFLAAFALGTLACGFARTYHELLILRSITGLFGGLLGPFTQAIVGDLVPPEKRGRAMGTLTIGFGFASVIGVPFAILISSALNWRYPFYVLTLLTLGVILTVLRVLPRMNNHMKDQKAFRLVDTIRPIQNAIREPLQRNALIFISLVVLGQFTIITFLSPTMVANVGFSERELGLIYLVGGLFSVFAAQRIGKLADQYGKVRIFQIAALFSILPIFIITHLGPTSVVLTLCITTFLFACINGRWISTMALMTSIVPPQKRGAFMSLNNAVISFSSSSAAYIAGLIVQKSPDGRLIHYDRAGFLAIGFTVMAMLLSRKFKFLKTDPT